MGEDWVEKTLGQILSLEYGKSLPGKSRDGLGRPVYGSNGIVGFHSAPSVNGPGIVVGRKGTAGSVTWVDEDFTAIDTTYWVKLVDPDVTMRYAFLLLEHVDLPSICAQTGVPGLNRDRAYEVKVSLPPLAVQRRIVDLMAHLDNHLGNLKAERDAARSDLMRDRERLLSRGAIVDAGDAFDILMGRQRSPDRADGPSMTLYLRAANIKNGELDLSDVKSMDFDVNERLRYSVNLGDVLVTEGSGSANAVGAAARWQGELAGPVCFQNTLLRFRARPGVSTPSFTYQWCRWAYESGAFRETATGTNILHIGATRAVKMPVRLPFVVEQDEACAILEDRELLLGGLDAEIRALEVVRSALLGELLSGRVSIDQSYDSLLPEVS